MRAAAPTIDHETVEWKIKVAENVIASSLAELAISGLRLEQRRRSENASGGRRRSHTVLGVNAVEGALGF